MKYGRHGKMGISFFSISTVNFLIFPCQIPFSLSVLFPCQFSHFPGQNWQRQTRTHPHFRLEDSVHLKFRLFIQCLIYKIHKITSWEEMCMALIPSCWMVEHQKELFWRPHLDRYPIFLCVSNQNHQYERLLNQRRYFHDFVLLPAVQLLKNSH